ncbi:MAG: hypothetical protein HYU63_09370 [Armatimonadetes bacterium]|nr:hypothetical protein [Armatimonadota bacterium]
MFKKNKLLDKMRRSKKGWRFNDVENLYIGFGFEKYEGGKHTIFIHPDFPELRATVARHSSLAIGYIQVAIKLIDKLNKLQRR